MIATFEQTIAGFNKIDSAKTQELVNGEGETVNHGCMSLLSKFIKN